MDGCYDSAAEIFPRFDIGRRFFRWRGGRGKKTSVNASHGQWLVGFFCACMLIGLMVFAGLLSLQIYCSVNKMEGFSFEDATTTGKNQIEGFYGENGCLGRRILFLNWEFVNKYT
ncbi:hypothetical protein AVEN_170227-1, partial [Araneus ventricosus]